MNVLCFADIRFVTGVFTVMGKKFHSRQQFPRTRVLVCASRQHRFTAAQTYTYTYTYICVLQIQKTKLHIEQNIKYTRTSHISVRALPQGQQANTKETRQYLVSRNCYHSPPLLINNEYDNLSATVPPEFRQHSVPTQWDLLVFYGVRVPQCSCVSSELFNSCFISFGYWKCK